MTLLIPARTTLQSLPPQEQQQQQGQLSSTEKVLKQEEAVEESIDATTTPTTTSIRQQTNTTSSDDNDNGNAIIIQQEQDPEVVYTYESKKPTWWKNVARKKATKGQRRIINNLQSSHILYKPKQYGTFINWDTVFETIANTTTEASKVITTAPIQPLHQQDYEIWYEIGFGTGDNLLCLAQQSEEKENLQQQQQEQKLESDFVRIVNSKKNNNYEIIDTCNDKPEQQSVQEQETAIKTTILQPSNNNKRRYYIGSEMYQSGFGTILSRIYNNSIINNQYYTDYQLYSNTTNNTTANNNNNNNNSECDTNALTDPNKTISEKKTTTTTIVSDNDELLCTEDKNKSYECSDNEYDDKLIDQPTPPSTTTKLSSGTVSVSTNSTASGTTGSDDPLSLVVLKKKYTNIKVYNGDGVRLLSYIPSSTIHVIMINFPDPFPRKKEQQWRIVQVSTLLQIYRTLYKQQKKYNNTTSTSTDNNCENNNTNIPGRFFLATDHYGYYQWVVTEQIVKVNNKLQRIQHKQQQSQSTSSHYENYNCQFVPVLPCPDRFLWLPVSSKYEQKGYKEGRTCTYTACWEIK